MYQSDITSFIKQLKDADPKLETKQQQGRALLWDKKPIDLDVRAQETHARVRQTPYVYYQTF